ncbi:MAG: RDD family protein [Planctomycetota bacterium]
MSAVKDSAVEFRCKNCWQQVYAPVSEAGTEISCPHCAGSTVVPQADESNTCSGEILKQQTAGVESKQQAARDADLEGLSTSELYQVVSQESAVPMAEMDFAGYQNASLLARLGAAIIDGLYSTVAALLGVLAVFGSMRIGLYNTQDFLVLLENPPTEAYLIVYFPLLLAQIIQWNLIATRGQSVGKFICCIRIVTMHGRLPGFLQGVVIRNWLTYLFSGIPFFSLIDIAFIFTDSHRCLHDHMAGTRVVNA